MAEVALGAITFTGNPIRATNNLPDPTVDTPASTYRVFHVPTNVGDAFGGDTTLNPSMLQGIFWILQAPSPNTDQRPFYQSPAVEERSDAYDMQNLYLDGTTGDTVVVSYIEAQLANISLGVIAVTPGTPLRLTNNKSDPTAAVWAHSYMVEAFGATGGDGYVGNSVMVKATGVGVFGRIPKSTATQYFYFQATAAIVHDLFDLSAVYLDGDVSGSYLVSAIEA